MRDDLRHLVREAGKSRGPSHQTRKWSLPYRADWDEDTSPTHVPMRPRKVRARKESGIRTNPLRRCLRARVGTPWTTTYHILKNLFRRSTPTDRGAMVEVAWVTGSDKYRHSTSILHIDGQGMLQATPLRPYQRPADFLCNIGRCGCTNAITGKKMCGKQWKPIDDTRYAIKEGGIWYMRTIGWHEPSDVAHFVPVYGRHPRLNITIQASSIPITYAERPDLPRWYEIDKRQINRKMLRQLGLRNDHPLVTKR